MQLDPPVAENAEFFFSNRRPLKFLSLLVSIILINNPNLRYLFPWGWARWSSIQMGRILPDLCFWPFAF